MKKNDIFIILGILVVAGTFFAWNHFSNKGQGDALYADIYFDGELYEHVDLTQDKEIVIDEIGHNTLEIRDGQVLMTEADCPDQVCVKSGEVDRVGENIVCLPNRVHVVIVGEKEAEVDVIAE